MLAFAAHTAPPTFKQGRRTVPPITHPVIDFFIAIWVTRLDRWYPPGGTSAAASPTGETCAWRVAASWRHRLSGIDRLFRSWWSRWRAVDRRDALEFVGRRGRSDSTPPDGRTAYAQQTCNGHQRLRGSACRSRRSAPAQIPRRSRKWRVQWPVSRLPSSPEEACRITDPRLDETQWARGFNAASGCLWTHNDSGDSARIFALDALTCDALAEVKQQASCRDAAISVGRDV